ncbi:MAG: IS982 family transposase [Longispora sp.]|nr:IS982 family transposase [Longispora sp. (in: high G+C Gram-positive bacteria)]
MRPDLDTLLIALYVFIDDHVVPAERRHPGQPKRLSDSELVCLAVAQVLLGARSEHHWIRMCYTRLGHLFPYLPQQPGYHKRVKAAAPLIAAATQALARQVPSFTDAWRLIDTTPLPCGTSRETTKRSELAGWANYGYCAAHSRWYWGLKLYLVTTMEGMPITWALADPKLGEREVAAELCAYAGEHDLLTVGVVLIGDKGFAGADFTRQMTGLGITFLRPDRRDEPRRYGNLAPVRQRIESIIDTCKGQLDLERHGGRTPAGVFVRVAQRVLAMAAAIWHNWLIDAPVKRSLIAYDS